MSCEPINISIVDEQINHSTVSEEIWCEVQCVGSAGSSSSSSGLFITDVVGTGIVSNKQYVPNTVPVNTVITEVDTDTDTVFIHFMVEGGTLYSPIVEVDGIECTNLQQYANDRRLFFGSVEVDSSVSRDITVTSTSADTSATVHINRADAGPVITDILFVNGYPGVQTEVKAGDSFELRIDFDPNGTEPIELYVANHGVSAAEVISLAGSGLVWGTNHFAIVTIHVKATGNTPTLLGLQASARNAFGTFGNSLSTDDSGVVDGMNLLLCNDVSPYFDTFITNYPVNQQAFKDNEVGTQQITVHEFTTVLYSSPNGDFTITAPTVYTQAKNITCTNPGSYNDSVNNYRVTAHRAENDTQASVEIIIEVADVAPTIVVTQPQARLRSSNAGTSYLITATSDQSMMYDEMYIEDTSGTWQGSWGGSLKVKSRQINITDVDAKGSFAWQFVGGVPENRAGIPAQSISGTEIVGGFLPRTLTVDAWPNRESLIGTEVVDPSKLVCENLSKGGNASNGGTIFIYKADTTNEADRYTITGGNTWYNCDQSNAVSNTSGTAQVIIEETV